MKCKLPNQDAGTARVFIGEAMEDYYSPPGKDVHEENDVKYITVQEEVGEVLIEKYGYEAYEESSDDQEDSDKVNNNDNSK